MTQPVTFLDGKVTLYLGDVRAMLALIPSDSVDCVVTSPPYWGLRDYGVAGQLGLEPTLGEHLAAMVDVFREVRRVLKPEGTCWVNYGDCYATSPNGRSAADTKAAGNDDRTFRDKPFSTIQGVLKAKDLCMVPNRLAIALQEDGWYVRSEIIWAKPNPMPESIRDRPASSHEKIFMFTKSARYFYDPLAVRQNRVQDEDANTFRGGSYVGGVPGPRAVVGNTKVAKQDKTAASAAQAGGSSGRRMAGFNERWDDAEASGRTQKRRAMELVIEHGLTELHIEAIRICGISDTGKALVTQTGAGHSDPEMMRLAAEAKEVLGGYYREFLSLDGRNLRNYERAAVDVWEIATAPFSEAHFATFPPELAARCIKAGCPKDGVVLDIFGGAGTTGLVAARLGRRAILIELNPEYADIAQKRIERDWMGEEERRAARTTQITPEDLPLFGGNTQSAAAKGEAA
jgi:DNA modification methylase